MRKYVILLIFTIFFAGLSYYLLQTLNPFDLEKINELVVTEEIAVVEEFDLLIDEFIGRGLIFQLLNVRNVALIGTTLSLSLISGFMFMHLLVDKIFFKRFYEEPNLLTALRRGLFFSVGVVSILVFRIFHADDLLSLLTIGLLLVVEIAVTRLFSSFSPKKPDLPKADEGASGKEGGEEENLHEEPKERKQAKRRLPKVNIKKVFTQFSNRDLNKGDQNKSEIQNS